MKRTYHGSCHCGAVAFTCALDLAADGTSKCNCSICTKSRMWKAIARADEVQIDRGADMLTDYQFGGQNIHHLFCKRCGVKAFGRGELPDLGPFYAISVLCLDDASADEIAAAPLEYQDGKNDAWERRPAEIRHL
jgi:hypothetical protein